MMSIVKRVLFKHTHSHVEFIGPYRTKVNINDIMKTDKARKDIKTASKIVLDKDK